MLVHAFYQPCPTCQAPWLKYLPEGWTITTRSRKRRGGPRVQYARVHTPDCPQGFPKVEIPDVEPPEAEA